MIAARAPRNSARVLLRWWFASAAAIILFFFFKQKTAYEMRDPEERIGCIQLRADEAWPRRPRRTIPGKTEGRRVERNADGHRGVGFDSRRCGEASVSSVDGNLSVQEQRSGGPAGRRFDDRLRISGDPTVHREIRCLRLPLRRLLGGSRDYRGVLSSQYGSHQQRSPLQFP